jgi:hypothetical protein
LAPLFLEGFGGRFIGIFGENWTKAGRDFHELPLLLFSWYCRRFHEGFDGKTKSENSRQFHEIDLFECFKLILGIPID